jgi:murein L,D-transpeptidase YcbB/YkuD
MYTIRTIMAKILPLCLIVSSYVHAASAEITSYHLSAYLQPTLQTKQLHYEGIDVDPSALVAFYQSNQFTPIWVTGNQLNMRAMQAINVISKATNEHGLFTANYGLEAIRHIALYRPQNEVEATQVALALEVLMSNAVYNYARDMHGENIQKNWSMKIDTPRVNATTLLSHIASTNDIQPIMSGLTPTNPDYRAMQNVLEQYQTIANQGGWPEWKKGARIKIGTSDERIPTLARILAITGDLPATEAPSFSQAIQYDGALVTALKSFQERHGIENDGIIGDKTQTALAVPVSQRIQQIAATMVRMRSLPSTMGDRHILVNIPGYYLKGYEGTTPTLAMRVIVGKPTTRTPLFSNKVTDVVFNPTWSAPQSIITKELLPKLRSNPSYFNRANFSVLQTKDGVTSEVDPLSIDYSNAGYDGARYNFRQKPGSSNALGKVKFNIPNSDDIYLHSTSQPQLFAKQERALSHGCIRLEKPKALAEYVLQSEGWESHKVDNVYNNSESRNVKVQPLPVHLVYWTSWVDDNRRPHFSPDIYGIDRPILAAMNTVKTQAPMSLALN